jgi:phage gpG-like protein
MKLKIKANFDFGKMASKLPKVIDKFLNESYADVVAKDSKKFIESGKVRPTLSKESTKEIRKKRGQNTTKPLYATGALANSLSKSKKGLRMKSYGTLHLEGFRTAKSSMIPLKDVRARSFLQVDNLSKITSKFYDALELARKK